MSRGGVENYVVGRKKGPDGEARGFGGGGWDGHSDYFAHKNAQLRSQYGAGVDVISACLRGVVVHVDGATATRKDELAELVTAHGGSYSQYPGRGVTHFVVNTVPIAKVKQWHSERKLRTLHVVQERWLLDSARQRRRLPEGDYALRELLHPHQQGLWNFSVSRAPPAPAAAPIQDGSTSPRRNHQAPCTSAAARNDPATFASSRQRSRPETVDSGSQDQCACNAATATVSPADRLVVAPHTYKGRPFDAQATDGAARSPNSETAAPCTAACPTPCTAASSTPNAVSCAAVRDGRRSVTHSLRLAEGSLRLDQLKPSDSAPSESRAISQPRELGESLARTAAPCSSEEQRHAARERHVDPPMNGSLNEPDGEGACDLPRTLHTRLLTGSASSATGSASSATSLASSVTNVSYSSALLQLQAMRAENAREDAPRLSAPTPSPHLVPSPSPSPLCALLPSPRPSRASKGELRVGIGGLVVHVDVDAMFAQCHQLEEPRRFSRHAPIAVQQHGDIIAVNHLAKACGVEKRMDPAEARRRIARAAGETCGEARGGALGGVVHVPTDAVGRVSYRLYQKHSAALLALWRHLAHTFDASAVLERHGSSYDEAYIDCATQCEARARVLAELLRVRSLDLGFEVSVGVARTKQMAKFASVCAKPYRGGSGLCVAVASEAADALLACTPLSALPKRLRSDGLVRRLGDESGARARDSHAREEPAPPSIRDVRSLRHDAHASDIAHIYEEDARAATDAVSRADDGDDGTGASLGAERAGACRASTADGARGDGSSASRRPPRAEAQQRAAELWALAHGQPFAGSLERVREQEPRQRVQVACSLSATPLRKPNGTTTRPMRVGDAALLRPFVESVALEMLQRAAIHRDEHEIVPQGLEIGLNLLSPSLSRCGSECRRCVSSQTCRLDPSERHASSIALPPPLLMQIERCGVSDDGRDQSMAAAVEHATALALSTMAAIAAAHTWNGASHSECYVKRFSLTLHSFRRVTPPKQDVRTYFARSEPAATSDPPASRSVLGQSSSQGRDAASGQVTDAATDQSESGPRVAAQTQALGAAALPPCPRVAPTKRPLPNGASTLSPQASQAQSAPSEWQACTSSSAVAQQHATHTHGTVASPPSHRRAFSAADDARFGSSCPHDAQMVRDSTPGSLSEPMCARHLRQCCHSCLCDPSQPVEPTGTSASETTLGSGGESAYAQASSRNTQSSHTRGRRPSFVASAAKAEVDVPSLSALDADDLATKRQRRCDDPETPFVSAALAAHAEAPAQCSTCCSDVAAVPPPTVPERLHVSVRCTHPHAPTQARVLQLLLDTLQGCVGDAWRAYALADDEAVSCSALDAETIRRCNLQQKCEQAIETSLSWLLQDAGADADDEIRRVMVLTSWSVGAAASVSLARIAASNALASSRDRRVVLADGCDPSLLLRRPVVALVPCLSPAECAQLLWEGVATCADFAQLGMRALQRRFGGRAEELLRMAESGETFAPRLSSLPQTLLQRLHSAGMASSRSQQRGSGVSPEVKATACIQYTHAAGYESAGPDRTSDTLDDDACTEARVVPLSHAVLPLASADGRRSAGLYESGCADVASDRTERVGDVSPHTEVVSDRGSNGTEIVDDLDDASETDALGETAKAGLGHGDRQQAKDDDCCEVGLGHWPREVDANALDTVDTIVDGGAPSDDERLEEVMRDDVCFDWMETMETVAESPVQRGESARPERQQTLSAGDVSAAELERMALPSLSQVAPEVFAGAWGTQLQQHYEECLQRRDYAQQKLPDSGYRAAVPSDSPAARTAQTLQSGGVARDAAAGWSCAACTYLNSNAEYLQCEMCGTQRPYVEPNEEADSSMASCMGDSSITTSRRPAPISKELSASARPCQRDGRASGQLPSHSAEQLPNCSAAGLMASTGNASSSDWEGATFCIGANASETLSHSPPAQHHVHAEDWFTVLPHLKAWIDSDCNLSAAPLVEYASILIKSGRLEELGYLSHFLRRESKRCAHLQPCLRDFLGSAEALFTERYPRSRFKPFATLQTTVSAHGVTH